MANGNTISAVTNNVTITALAGGAAGTRYLTCGGTQTAIGSLTINAGVTCTLTVTTPPPVNASVDLKESGKVTTTSEEISIK